jgi:hypothetical protein
MAKAAKNKLSKTNKISDEIPSTDNLFSALAPKSKKPASIELPRVVKIYPLMAVRANAAKKGGAFRLWVIARAIVSKGSGAILADVLKKTVINAGIDRATFQRWLKEALCMNVLEQKTKASGNKIIIIRCPEKAANAFGCVHVGTRPCYFETQVLLKGDWRKKAWEAFLYQNFNKKTVSRKVLAEITGINRFEQIRLEKDNACIHNLINIAETNISPSQLTGQREFGRPTAFIFKGKVAYRLPDTRIIDSQIKPAPRGRTKSINQALNELTRISLPTEVELSNPDRSCNDLFFSDPKKLDHAFRKFGLLDIQINELFLLIPKEYKHGKSRHWTLVSK